MKISGVRAGGLVAMLAVSPATAEDGRHAIPGALVRLTAPTISETPLIGTVVDSHERELTLAASGAGHRTIPLDAVTKIEWSSGRHNQAGKFARKGAIIGAAVFAVALARLNNDDAGERSAGAALGAASGAFWGGLAGAAIGAFRHTYDWKEAPLSPRPTSSPR